jgi:hypothetical protein
MPMRRQSSAVLLVLFLISALTACVGIPTSGSVIVGQALDEEGTGDFEFLPFEPVAGASQEEILRGFVAAFTGSADDYEVARQFLSTGFSDEWNPRSNVTVRTAAERLVTIDDDSMEYAINADATVDASGVYQRNNGPEPQALSFDFVQENGEWRISQANDGIVLSDATFRQIFHTHVLYFLDPTNEHLVPDLRWFAGGTAALRIASELLDGPPEWLQGAIRTAFPEGTELAVPGVDVESGVAIIDLSTEALAAGARDRQLMQLQLAASLANVSNIRGVNFTVAGTPLVVPESAVPLPQLNAQVDARLVGLSDGEFGYVARDVTQFGQLSAKVVETQPRGATLTAGVDAAAVLGVAGVSIVQSGDAATTLLDTRPDLITPSLDGYGYVWSAARSSPGSIRAYGYGGAFVDVATGLPPNTEIVSVDVSRDGARIAIFLSTTSGPRIVVKAINRDANAAQVPVSVSLSALDANLPAGTAVDATWVDELSVATLSDVGGQSTVTRYEVGGDRASLGQPGNSVSLVGGNGVAGLRALSADGTVLARSGNGWTDTRIPVAFIATQR